MISGSGQLKKNIIMTAVSLIFLAAGGLMFYLEGRPASVAPLSFGGPLYDSARAIISEKNGYVIAGMTSSSGIGHVDFYWARLNRRGKLKKETTFGGKGDDRCYAMKKAPGQGYIMAGFTTSYGSGGKDAYIVNADRKGKMIFSKAVGGKHDDIARDIVVNDDGSFLVVGTGAPIKPENTDIMAFMVGSDGNIIWQNHYGSISAEEGYAALKSAQNTYIIAGTTRSEKDLYYDIYLVEINSSGSILENRVYKEKGMQVPYDIISDGNSGYVIAAETGDPDGNSQGIKIINIDAQGNILWEEKYGGMGLDKPAQIIRISDKGYVLVGYTYSMGHGMSDAYILKIDSAGKMIFQRAFGGKKDDYAGGVVEDEDGSLAVAGWAASYGNDYEVFFFKTDRDGFIE